jgi:hypothetical protein
MQTRHSSRWYSTAAHTRSLMLTAVITAAAVLLSLAPVPIISYPAAFVVAFLLPGVQVARFLGLYSSWREGRTLILSIASGLLFSPILGYWVSIGLGFDRWLILAALALFSLGGAGVNALWPNAGRPGEPLCQSRRQYACFGVLLTVLSLGILLTYIEGYSAEGVYPVEMGDWFKHYGVAWSIRNTGVPPVDIFFYGDPSRERLSYYYFFHLSVAILDLLHGGETSIYHSSVVMVLATALSFVCVFYLLAGRVLRKTSAALWSLFCATVVGGLDIIPMIPRNIELFQKENPGAPLGPLAYFPADHIDNWAPAPYLRLNTLFATYIWVPQHVMALMAFVLGLYLIREVSNRRRLVTAAPFLLLTLIGHSAWIAMIAGLCILTCGLYHLWTRWRQAGRDAAVRTVGVYVLVGVAFLAISFPLLRDYSGPAAPKSGIVFEIPLTREWSWLSPFKTQFSDTLLSRWLDIQLHYVWELGALLVCGIAGLWLFARRVRTEVLMPCFLAPIVIGFAAITFFASGRAWSSMGFTLNNDLGMRAIMPAQALLALFAGYFLAIWGEVRWHTLLKPVLSTVVGILIVLGVGAFLWEVCAMGVAKYLKPPRIDAPTYRAFQAMKIVTEPMSVVKHRTHDNASSYQLMFGDRSPGFFTVEAAVFHPDLREVAYQFGLSRFAYMNRLPTWSYQMFREMYADYVYVGAIDRDKDLSPEKFDNPTYYQPVYQEGDIAIYKVRDLEFGQVEARFTPANIEYLGHIIDEHPEYPIGFATRSPRALVTAWKLEQPVEQDFTVYVHFLEADGRVVAQTDHLLWSWSNQNQAEGPTSMWETGRMLLDIIPIPTEVLSSTVPLQIGIGLWVPEKGEYQQAEPVNLSLDAQGRLVIGTYRPLIEE